MQKTLMNDWLRSNRDSILKKYPEANPMLVYFFDYFNSCSGGFSFENILENAINGQGASIQESASYLLMNDDLDDGCVVDHAQFYYYDELDGKVPFKTFALVLELIALAYIDYHPEDKERITLLLTRLKKVYQV